MIGSITRLGSAPFSREIRQASKSPTIPCILARYQFELHLREVFEQKRVDKRYLPHLLTHYFGADDHLTGPEIFQLLLENGCRVIDLFLGRSAWEQLLWHICLASDNHGIVGDLEACRISLEKGADPNLVIQPITADHFDLDYRDNMAGEAKRHSLPCFPLHMITASPFLNTSLSALFQTIKKFLEYGARLDAENIVGETVLENAANWTLKWKYPRQEEKRSWNFAPILLRLQSECQIASKSEVDLVPDLVPQDTILDLLEFSEEMSNDKIRLELEVSWPNLRKKDTDMSAKRQTSHLLFRHLAYQITRMIRASLEVIRNTRSSHR